MVPGFFHQRELHGVGLDQFAVLEQPQPGKHEAVGGNGGVVWVLVFFERGDEVGGRQFGLARQGARADRSRKTQCGRDDEVSSFTFSGGSDKSGPVRKSGGEQAGGSVEVLASIGGRLGGAVQQARARQEPACPGGLDVQWQGAVVEHFQAVEADSGVAARSLPGEPRRRVSFVAGRAHENPSHLPWRQVYLGQVGHRVGIAGGDGGPLGQLRDEPVFSSRSAREVANVCIRAVGSDRQHGRPIEAYRRGELVDHLGFGGIIQRHGPSVEYLGF